MLHEINDGKEYDENVLLSLSVNRTEEEVKNKLVEYIKTFQDLPSVYDYYIAIYNFQVSIIMVYEYSRDFSDRYSSVDVRYDNNGLVNEGYRDSVNEYFRDKYKESWFSTIESLIESSSSPPLPVTPKLTCPSLDVNVAAGCTKNNPIELSDSSDDETCGINKKSPSSDVVGVATKDHTLSQINRDDTKERNPKVMSPNDYTKKLEIDHQLLLNL